MEKIIVCIFLFVLLLCLCESVDGDYRSLSGQRVKCDGKCVAYEAAAANVLRFHSQNRDSVMMRKS